MSAGCDVRPARGRGREPRHRLALVQPGGMRLEADAPNVSAEGRVRRETDLMTGSLQRAGERDHRVEMTVADDACEEDPHCAVQPPSTVRTLPVTIPATGDARYRIAAATSEVVATRPAGIRSNTEARNAGSSSRSLVPGV